MPAMRSNFQTIDEYIGTFPKNVQAILQNLRRTISKAAPEAEEKISYQIPTFSLHGNLVHFAAWKNHIGFYLGSKAGEAFKKELSRYGTAKGSVKFPLERPLPLQLITRIVKYRVRQNLEKERARAKKK